MKPIVTTLLIAASVYGLYHTADRILTAQLTAGPFEVTADETAEYEKSNITESQRGLPIQYVLTVVKDNITLPGIRLDIWFANASGVYSGVSVLNTLDEDYLRGWQLTNDSGVAVFDGIFPGPYPGRTLHVHLRVRQYAENGTVIYNKTSQLFFPENINEEVMQLPSYQEAAKARWNTNNSDDAIFAAENVVNMTGNPTTGYVVTYTIELPLTDTLASGPTSGPGASGPPGFGAGPLPSGTGGMRPPRSLCARRNGRLLSQSTQRRRARR